MQIKYISLLYIVFFLLVLNSCHKPVSDDSYYQYEKKKPVLNAVLQPDSLIRAHLSFSCGLTDTVMPLIENATVIIYSTNTKDTLSYTGGGWYESLFRADYETVYNCIVEIPDYPTLFVSTTTQEQTLFDQMEIIETADIDEEGNSITSISFVILNTPDKIKFWEVKLTNRGYVHTMEGDLVYEIKDNNITFKVGQDEVLQNEALPLSVFSNKKMKGDTYKVTIYFARNFVSDHDLYIELRTIDESYYLYQKQLYLYNTSGGVGLGTSPQSYPLYSNVTNGLGIFTSYTSYIQSITLK